MNTIKWRENLTLVGGMIVITLLFILCIETPIRRKIRLAEQEMEASRAMLGGFPEQVRELEELKTKITHSRGYLDRVRKLVPEDDHLDRVLEVVTDLGKNSELNITRLEPISPVSRESYEQLPVRLTAEGSYEGIHRFCYALENGERLVGIDDLTLTGKDGENEGNVKLEMVFTAYVDRSVQ